MNAPTMRPIRTRVSTKPATDELLAFVPVTWTLCLSRSGVREVSSRATGICEV